MKKYLIFITLMAAFLLPIHAQTTNAPPAITTAPVTVNTAPASTTAYYRLVYDPVAKKVVALVYSTGITRTTYPINEATTYAAEKSFATTNNLTGLPPQKTGQP